MKQQQLTFEKGMTNVPSDVLCSDNALEDSVGLIYREGEHHVIQKPKVSDSPSKALLFPHQTSSGKYYIYYGTAIGEKMLYYKRDSNWTYVPGSGYSDSIGDVTAIGNTLIVILDGKVHYFLFKNGSYSDITDIPEVDFNIWLQMDTLVPVESIMRVDRSWFSGNVVLPEHQEDYNNVVIGLYSKNKKTLAKAGRVVNPFMVRFALELYDGSYTRLSAPIMLFPCVTRNSYVAQNAQETQPYLHMITQGPRMWYKVDVSRLDAYNDIVKGIAVFMTDEVDVYDTSADQPFEFYTSSDYCFDSIINGVYSTDDQSTVNFKSKVLQSKSTVEIANQLVTSSLFYKIGTIGLGAPSNTALILLSSMEGASLEKLTTKERLEHDDYYSHCKYYPNHIYSYNSRLHLADVNRSFFPGFPYFMTYGPTVTNQPTYTFYVTLKTSIGDIVVAKSVTTSFYQGIYFYYPDPRASHVVIKKVLNNTESCVCDANLTEHPGLNGAYYFKGLPGLTGETTVTGATYPSVTTIQSEPVQSTLITSEVNNPFTFLAQGYIKVGDGSIIGMSAQTHALSQGQFGEHPLIVFTTEGIWALSLNSIGEYTNATPFSREIALSDHPAITQTDNAIYFVSKKGLMVVAGSMVKCVSEQLSGKNNSTGTLPSTLFSNCFIAYDYRDSLLWIFNGSGSTNALVFSMKSGTFGKMTLGFTPARVVSDYPDYLIQATSGNNGSVYTLYGRVDINTEAASTPDVTYNCSLVSRPLKLENGLALKRIIQVMHIKDLVGDQAGLTFSMEGSNDMEHWFTLTSLRSVPWKYYKFTYSFTHLKATSTFAGTVLTTEEVRTDKLR